MVLLASSLPFLALLLMPAVASLSGWPAPVLVQIRRALMPTVAVGGIVMAVFALTGEQYIQAGVAVLSGAVCAGTLWFDHDDDTVALTGGLSLGAVIVAPLTVVGIVLGVLIAAFSFFWPRILNALQGDDDLDLLAVAQPRKVAPVAQSVQMARASVASNDVPVPVASQPVAAGERPSLPSADPKLPL